MHGHSSPAVSTTVSGRKEALSSLGRAVARAGLDPLKNRLFELQAWLADDLGALEQNIVEFERAGQGGARHPLTGQRVRGAVMHLLALPGKRIRPLCVLLAARMGGRSLDSTVRDLAVACELVHAATLLHDDVIDDSSERRGAPAARVVFGNAASILAGDHLLVEALRLVEAHRALPGLPSLLDVISQMVHAEAMQLERRGRFEPSRQIYLDVIRGKTSALFYWGLRAGGVAGGLGDPVAESLGAFGLKLGMAFQLVDDLLDLKGDAQVTGKDVLVDMREGKLTWPAILGAERDDGIAQDLARIASGRDSQVAQRAASVVARLHRCGAIEETQAFARQMADEACAELDRLPAGPARDALGAVAIAAVDRVN